MKYYYGYTIKRTVKDDQSTINTLLNIFDLVFPQTDIISEIMTFENDSKGRLHAHGTLTSLHKLNYREHKMYSWHIYLRRIYDHTGWLRYVKKDIKQKNDLRDEFNTTIYN